MDQPRRRAILMASIALGCTLEVCTAQAQTSPPAVDGPANRPAADHPATARRAAGQDFARLSPSAGAQAPARTSPAPAQAATPAPSAGVGEIIVTAQKRSQSINNVGLSITAVSGDVLASRGVTDVSQLAKLVPGFNFNLSSDQSPIYTIRGVGYQDSSIAASPAVTVYVDEVPLPYSNETLGAALDLERVEVLKGPQGTLYGGNSTGGAINYIAAKPADHFTAGFSEDFGRFSSSNLTGYVSGPITDTLSVRLSGRWLEGGAWQRSYTRDDTLGDQDQLFGRLIADWRPTSTLKVELNANGWRSRSESQAGQLFTKEGALPIPLDPTYLAYPFAPQNARAADWDAGADLREHNSFKQVSGRVDYQATDTLRLTSISSYEDYLRDIPVDRDGTSLPVDTQISTGHSRTFFQEVRAGLTVAESGNVTLGANYQHDKIDELDRFLTVIGTNRIIGGHDFDAQNRQTATSKAVFGSADVPLTSQLSVVGGVRYTRTDRSYSGCTKDTGDGQAATAFNALLGVNVQSGGCLTIEPNLQPGLFNSEVNQDNVSWRGGLNYKPDRNILLYANVSRGYKAGGFQALPAGTYTSLKPVVQEELTAYETGFKVGLFDHRLQLNGAGFYYSYDNKQIRSISVDPITGSSEALINIPRSRVTGFELSAAVHPITGLSVTSSITLVDSKVLGSFTGVTPSSVVIDVRGQAFPYTPKWSGDTDVEYRWPLVDRLQGVVGATVTYDTATNEGFGNEYPYRIRGYVLLDLRAGVEGDGGKWRLGLYARNATDQYYWTTAARAADGGIRYAALPVTYGVSLAYRY